MILKRDVEAATRIQASMVQETIPATLAGDGIAARRPLSGMRKAVARRMMDSLSGCAQMTGFGKIDMTNVVRVRFEVNSLRQLPLWVRA